MTIVASDDRGLASVSRNRIRETLALRWAGFACQSTWAELPATVQREAVRCQINWLAVALGGSTSHTVDRALAATAAIGSSGGCTAVGHAHRLDPVAATFINALSASALAYDDTHLATITHPGAPVVSAAWAVAEHQSMLDRPPSAQDVLHAIALGVEIQCRLSNAIVGGGRGAHLGWYTTGLSGGVGAALTAGLLLNLEQAALVAAVGLAAAQSGGVRSTHGSMATAFVPAFAARNGVASAYLASQGFTCTDDVLDGKNGLFDVLSPHCEPECMSHGLGSHFEMLTNTYKPYPCGIVIHAAIDACLAVGGGHELKQDQIAGLELTVHPSALALCGKSLPDDELNAQVSLFHWAACALLRPGQWVEAASSRLIHDADCRALQLRITAKAEPGLDRAQASARLRLKDGTLRQAHIEQATASVKKPMSDAQLDEKFLMLAQTAISLDGARALLLECRSLASRRANPVALIQRTRCALIS